MATQATPTTSPLHGPLIVAYPHFLTPRTTTMDGKTRTRFEGTILIPKDKPEMVEKLKAAIRAAFVFIRMDADLSAVPVEVLALSQAVPLYAIGLFVACMFCHGELVARKPAPPAPTTTTS